MQLAHQGLALTAIRHALQRRLDGGAREVLMAMRHNRAHEEMVRVVQQRVSAYSTQAGRRQLGHAVGGKGRIIAYSRHNPQHIASAI